MCTTYFNIANMHSQYTVTVFRPITILSSYGFCCFLVDRGCVYYVVRIVLLCTI